MRLRYTFLTLLFTTLSATASPTITGITPSSGRVSGGQTVIISGTGFTGNCGSVCQRMVQFGGALATSVRVLGPQTIEAVTPAHLPSAVDIVVCQTDGCATLRNGFTFVGWPSEAFEVLLLPLLTPPVYGAHGSEFRTELRGFNGGYPTLEIYGLDRRPIVILRPGGWNPLEEPFKIDPQRAIDLGTVESTGTPGALLYVAKNRIDDLSLHLRAYDVSRSTTNFGTELPVVRGGDFRTGPLMLLGVPLDPQFRNTLRIYSLDNNAALSVSIGGVERGVRLRSSTSLFDPAYAEITLPVGTGSVDVRIISPFLTPDRPARYWAFISVTNNETQMITTITPQP